MLQRIYIKNVLLSIIMDNLDLLGSVLIFRNYSESAKKKMLKCI